MKYRLLIKAEAIRDMTEAFDWYEEKRTGLGAEFLDEVETYYDRITHDPLHYPSHLDQRVAVMHRFPYKIEGDAIAVYAVYHHKRDPQKLAERK